MLIISNISIKDFNAIGDSLKTKRIIIENNKVNEFDNMIDRIYPCGISANHLNDLLCYGAKDIFEILGIKNE